MTGELLQQKMDEALALVESDPEAKALLDIAREDGVRIFFDEGLTGTGTLGQYTPSTRAIAIDPSRDLIETATTCTHELRHYWQYRQIGHGTVSEQSARTKLLYKRVIEADAYSFGFLFEMRLRRPPREEKTLSPALSQKFAVLAQESAIDSMGMFFESTLQRYEAYESGALNAVIDLWQGQRSHETEAETLANLRRILKAGVDAEAPSYVAHLSDKELKDLIMRDVSEGVVQLFGLTEKFNTAVAKGNKKEAKNLYRLSLEQASRVQEKKSPVYAENVNSRLGNLRRYFKFDTRGRWPKRRLFKKFLPHRRVPKN